MSISRRKFLVSTTAVAIALGLSAPLAWSQEEPKKGGTLTAVVTPEPTTLTSALIAATPTGSTSANIFDGLLSYDQDLKPQPELAESWAVSEDGKSITFNLRKGVKWHDGVPFTSADVAWTLENVWKPLHPRNPPLFRNIVRAETPDDHTIVFHLENPSVALMGILNSNGAQILPKHLYEGTDVLKNPYNTKPVGTGAFVFKEWVKGSHIILEKNENYWDPERPYLDRIIFKIVPDAAARAALIETGEILYAPFNPIALRDANRLGESPKIQITTEGYKWLSLWAYFDMNVDSPIFKDKRVRQAIAHSIDRDALIKVVWFGFGVPATSPVSSTAAPFHADPLPHYPYDTAKAEALLDEAGHKRDANGVRFSINHDFLPFGDDWRRMGEFLKQSLKRVGIEVTVRSQDAPSFAKRVYTDGDFDISSAYSAGLPDPELGVVRIYSGNFARKGIPYSNGSGYNNPVVEEIFQAARVEPDPAKRVELFKKFQEIVMDEVPTIPMMEMRMFTVHSSRVRNVVSRGDQVFASLRNVWLADE